MSEISIVHNAKSLVGILTKGKTMNQFLDALIMPYEYKCNGKTIKLTNEKTEHEHGKYFMVICDKCCNVKQTGVCRTRSQERCKGG